MNDKDYLEEVGEEIINISCLIHIVKDALECENVSHSLIENALSSIESHLVRLRVDIDDYATRGHLTKPVTPANMLHDSK